VFLKDEKELGMVAHANNPNIWEAQAGGKEGERKKNKEYSEQKTLKVPRVCSLPWSGLYLIFTLTSYLSISHTAFAGNPTHFLCSQENILSNSPH
jgi:hypothetical protein